MARPQVLERLKELGWTGPTSYTLPYLNELITRLEGGETAEAIEASRRKTSVKTEGGGRASRKGTWEQIEGDLTVILLAFSLPENDSADVVVIDGVEYRKIGDPEAYGGWTYERFVPTPPKVKAPKEPKSKGTWELRPWPGDPTELPPLDGEEVVLEGRRWRHRTVDAEGGVGNTEVFVPTPPKAPRERRDPQAEFDPRELLRTFEDPTLRELTGGYDLTLIDNDQLQAALDDARARSLPQATVAMPVGEAVKKDVVWLEALITVKRRLAARQAIENEIGTEANADEEPGAGSAGG